MSRGNRAASATVAVVVVAIGLARAWQLRWVAEDAYISLRYARNLAAGQGLVFNPGEYVEGYTNFLWTIGLAAGIALGGQGRDVAIGLGMACSLVALCGAVALHRRLLPGALVPVAVLALGLNYTAGSFLTSGLETPLLVALLTWSFVAADGAQRHRAAPVSGLLAGLAVLARPDAALVLPSLVGLAWARGGTRRERGRRCAAVGSGAAAVVVPHLAWRWATYGALVPNTFHAKGSGGAHVSQGAHYVAEFVARYPLWYAAPLALLAWYVLYRRGERPRPVLASIGTYIALHMAYVVWIGGDFMEGRFLVPVLPFALLGMECTFRRAPDSRQELAGLAILVGSTVLGAVQVPPGTIRDGIADERTWEPAVQAWLREGEVLSMHLPPGTLVATDAVGAFGWASDLPLLDTLGLTDASVARTPLASRGRPGHERAAPVEYLLERRVAVVRDGMGLYAGIWRPAFRYAGMHYYVLSDDPRVQAAVDRAMRELAAGSR